MKVIFGIPFALLCFLITQLLQIAGREHGCFHRALKDLKNILTIFLKEENIMEVK